MLFHRLVSFFVDLFWSAWGVLRPERIEVLGHRVSLPPGVDGATMLRFEPFEDWLMQAAQFLQRDERKLHSIRIERADVCAGEVTAMAVRVRARLEHVTSNFTFTLYPKRVVALFWCTSERGIMVLLLKEAEMAFPRERFTLPCGHMSRGTVKGASLQQLRLDTGLTIADATRLSDTHVNVSPDRSNETYEVYSANVPDLADLLDDEGRTTLLPLGEAMLHTDARSLVVLQNSERIFGERIFGEVSAPS